MSSRSDIRVWFAVLSSIDPMALKKLFASALTDMGRSKSSNKLRIILL